MLATFKRYKCLVPALIAALYFIVFGRYGFSDTDDGWMTSFAWRLFNGQAIYKDFIYIRPPVTPLIRAAVMNLVPINHYYLISDRALSCVLILSYSYIATTALRRIFPDDDSLREHGWIYTSCFFVFSLHNFSPAFAWYTIDGVFFSVAGAHFLLRGQKNSWISAVAAACLLIAAALTKQSFYPMALIGGAYLCFVRRKVTDIVAYFATCCALLVILAFTFKHYGILSGFIQQTTGSTHISDAIQAGGIYYLEFGLPYFCCCLVVALFAQGIIRLLPRALRHATRVDPLIVFLAVFFVLDTVFIIWNLAHSRIVFINQEVMGYSQAMFFVAAIFTALVARRNIDQGASFFVLLMISWCASISWGYWTPIWFAAPLIYGLIQGASLLKATAMPPGKAALLTLCFGLATFAICDLCPYRDLDGRLHDNRDLGNLAPRLSGIIAGDKERSKLAEFLKIQRQFGDRFITLSAFATSHFITGTSNPAPIDWSANSEMDSKAGEIFSRLSADDLYAVVDIRQRKKDEAFGDSRWHSDLLTMVENHWALVAVGTWYKVYATAQFMKTHPDLIHPPNAVQIKPAPLAPNARRSSSTG